MMSTKYRYTRVVGGQGSPIKIGYKLHLKGEQWMVYDAVIDDVSVVGNYRAQFARILHTATSVVSPKCAE